jgi:DNA topoisomerase VI, B subunit
VSLIIECDWQRAKARILEYVRRTAVIAPYSDIILQTPDGEILFFPRTTRKMPKPPRTAKPHPHGVDVETLKQMLRATKAKTLLDFLESEFQSVGEQSALEFLKVVGLKPEMKPRRLLRSENDGLLVTMVEAMKSFKFRAPRSDYLSPLGEELIKIGLKRMFNPEWVDAIKRPPRAYHRPPIHSRGWDGLWGGYTGFGGATTSKIC